MSERAPKVVVCGDIILDLFAQGLERLRYATDTHSRIVYRGGGSAANVAWWLAKKDVDTTLVGKVGQDPFGDFLLADLAAAGVKCAVARSTQSQTGMLMVLNDIHGERSMITDRGANLDLSLEDIAERASLLRGATLLHVSGYALLTDPPGQAVRYAMEKASSLNVPISLDPANHHMIEAFGPAELMRLINRWKPAFLWPNLWEAEAMTGCADPHQAAEVLEKAGAQIVVIKLGEDGVLVRRQDQSITIPAIQVSAVDTTGAGDALCAGFLASYLTTQDVVAAAKAGVNLAAEVVTYRGARPMEIEKQGGM